MFEGYVRVFEESPSYFFALFFLSLARIFPIVTLAPFLGAKILSQPARVAVAICLFSVLGPFLMAQIKTPLLWDATLIVYFLKETIVGLVLGFLVIMPFNIAQMAGILIDNQRGSSSLTGSDPILSNQVSSIGMLYNFLLIVIFFNLNGPMLFIDALIKSYQVIPPDLMPSADFFQRPSSFFWTYFVGLMGRIFALSVQLAAPSVVAILMSNVFLGIMNRLAPQVQISFLGQGLNAYSGDIALWAAWLFILSQLGKMALKWIQEINDMLQRITF